MYYGAGLHLTENFELIGDCIISQNFNIEIVF